MRERHFVEAEAALRAAFPGRRVGRSTDPAFTVRRDDLPIHYVACWTAEGVSVALWCGPEYWWAQIDRDEMGIGAEAGHALRAGLIAFEKRSREVADEAAAALARLDGAGA